MSRFVSGGTVDEPTERDEAWLQAQKEIEAKHLAKIEAGKQDGGKSLFETLQANKGDDMIMLRLWQSFATDGTG